MLPQLRCQDTIPQPPRDRQASEAPTHLCKGHQAHDLLCGPALAEADEQVLARDDANVAMQGILGAQEHRFRARADQRLADLLGDEP
jgi:hypothetical protein